MRGPCGHYGCANLARYGLSNNFGAEGIFCSKHKMPGMVFIYNRCDLCSRRGAYRTPATDGSRLLCQVHMKENAADPGFGRHPTCFNSAMTTGTYLPDDSRAGHCAPHWKEIIMSAAAPQSPGAPAAHCSPAAAHCSPAAASPGGPLRCILCGSRATHGVPGSAADVCDRHKIAGMIAMPHHRCTMWGLVPSRCTRPATHGDGKYAYFCAAHSPADMHSMVYAPVRRAGPQSSGERPAGQSSGGHERGAAKRRAAAT